MVSAPLALRPFSTNWPDTATSGKTTPERALLRLLHPHVQIAVAVAMDGQLPGVAADFAVLNLFAPLVGLDRDFDPFAAVGALDLDPVAHFLGALRVFFSAARPSFLTISNSGLATG